MDRSLEKEKALISQCRKDIKAFSEIYKKYLDDIYRYVSSVVKNRQEAEDIVSRTFLTAIEKIESFEWRGISIKFWLLKIARNLIYKSFNKVEKLTLEEEVELEDLDEKPVEDMIIQEDLKKKLKELIFRLDDLTREIITLRVWQELKFKEIAKLIEHERSYCKK